MDASELQKQWKLNNSVTKLGSAREEITKRDEKIPTKICSMCKTPFVPLVKDRYKYTRKLITSNKPSKYCSRYCAGRARVEQVSKTYHFNKDK